MGKRPKKTVGTPLDKKKIQQGLTTSKAGQASSRPTSSGDDSVDDSPLFFYMPNEKYGQFCQWFPSAFFITKGEIASLLGVTSSSLYPFSDPWQPNNPLNIDSTAGEEDHQSTEDQDKTEDVESSSPGADDEETPLFFKCAEKFMMYCKATRFGDIPTQRKILLCDSPKEHKSLGKATAGFTGASWDQVKFDVVVAGNMAKFGQNKAMREVLMGTLCRPRSPEKGAKKESGSWKGINAYDGRVWRGRELIEAASRDHIWGIGFTAANALKVEKEKWGQNLLGKALMEVRKRLVEEQIAKGMWEEGGEEDEDGEEEVEVEGREEGEGEDVSEGEESTTKKNEEGRKGKDLEL
ncbi:hypothetical protein V8F06_010202 [Rhypophila decipiens]